MTTDALGTAGGVVSAIDHRLSLGGTIAVQGPTALDARTGVLSGPGSTTILTGTAATGTMTVAVGTFHAVTARNNAGGTYLGPVQEAATTVNIAAAPASNSRIDVVWVKENDSDAAVLTPDGSTGAVLGVTTGVAAASPTKPAIPVGALELGTVTVAAGATSTNGAGVTIANTARQTVARGAMVYVRNATEEAALTAYDGLLIYRADFGQIKVFINGIAQIVYNSLATPPAGRLLVADSSGTTTATSTTPVTIAGIGGSFTLAASRKVTYLLHAQTCTGASGNELGRVTLNAGDGAGTLRHSQFAITVAAAAGEVSTTVIMSLTLAAGTYTPSANLLRVISGTSVSCSVVELVVLDGGS